jgi:cytoskeleton protein RodZ
MADNEPGAPTGSNAEASATLGDALRQARGAMGLSVEQLSAELRIEARHLAALEENRLEQIGVPVFVKGYLRQYGHRLGLDERDLLSLYYQQTSLTEVQIKPSKTIHLRDERQIMLWVIGFVVLAVVVVGLVVWWLNGAPGFGPRATSPTTSAAELAEPVAAAPSAATRVESPAPRPAANEPPRAAEVAPFAARPSAAGAPPPEARVAPTDERASAAQLAAGDGVALEVFFDQESWVEITDARGTRLYYGLGAAGRQATLRGEPPFAVVLGNAPAVRLVLDGAPYPVPTEGRQGKLARFSIDLAEE